MTDDLTNPGPEDGRFVSTQPHEIRYWTQKLGCTEEELKEAVEKVGNEVEAVRAEVAKIKAAKKKKQDQNYRP